MTSIFFDFRFCQNSSPESLATRTITPMRVPVAAAAIRRSKPARPRTFSLQQYNLFKTRFLFFFSRPHIVLTHVFTFHFHTFTFSRLTKKDPTASLRWRNPAKVGAQTVRPGSCSNPCDFTNKKHN